MMEAGQDKP